MISEKWESWIIERHIPTLPAYISVETETLLCSSPHLPGDLVPSYNGNTNLALIEAAQLSATTCWDWAVVCCVLYWDDEEIGSSEQRAVTYVDMRPHRLTHLPRHPAHLVVGLICHGGHGQHQSPPLTHHPPIWVKYLYYTVVSSVSWVNFPTDWGKLVKKKIIFRYFPGTFFSEFIFLIFLVCGGAHWRKVRGGELWASCVCSLIRLDHLFLLQFHYYVHASLSFSAPGTHWDCSAPHRRFATFLPRPAQSTRPGNRPNFCENFERFSPEWSRTT